METKKEIGDSTFTENPSKTKLNIKTERESDENQIESQIVQQEAVKNTTKCQVCKLEFAAENLYKHLLNCDVFCKHCGKKFANTWNKAKHENLAKCIKKGHKLNHSCGDCGESFRKKEEKKNHKKGNCPEKGKSKSKKKEKFRCQNCHEIFPGKNAKKRHRREFMNHFLQKIKPN